MSLKSRHKKRIWRELEMMNLSQTKMRCLTCNRKELGKEFVKLVVDCENSNCPHSNKIEWLKTAIGGEVGNIDEIKDEQDLLTSKENPHEHIPQWDFIYRDRVIK